MFRILITFCLLVLFLNVNAQSDASTTYIFGHSLLDHRPPAIPTPSDETTVPHWLQLLANHADKDFAASGKYGFLPQHANDPVFSQWGYDIVNSAWESDYEPFSDADFTTGIITAGNFIQYQAHTEEYYGDPGVTPLSATLDIIDFLAAQEDSMKIIIYENWPDMGSIAPDFPPTEAQLETYYAETAGPFHDWWIPYHNDLDAMRPDLDIKMVPVGPIFADILVNTELANIPVTELYEDNAPHGRASLYFLASLATYIAIYEEKPPVDYAVPSIVHPIIAANYVDIVNRMWTACVNFNFDDGRSRVFTQNGILNSQVFVDSGSITFYPNPVNDFLHLKGDLQDYTIEVLDSNAAVHYSYAATDELIIDMRELPAGMFYIRLINSTTSEIKFHKIVKQ